MLMFLVAWILETTETCFLLIMKVVHKRHDHRLCVRLSIPSITPPLRFCWPRPRLKRHPQLLKQVVLALDGQHVFFVGSFWSAFVSTAPHHFPFLLVIPGISYNANNSVSSDLNSRSSSPLPGGVPRTVMSCNLLELRRTRI